MPILKITMPDNSQIDAARFRAPTRQGIVARFTYHMRRLLSPKGVSNKYFVNNNLYRDQPAYWEAEIDYETVEDLAGYMADLGSLGMIPSSKPTAGRINDVLIGLAESALIGTKMRQMVTADWTDSLDNYGLEDGQTYDQLSPDRLMTIARTLNDEASRHIVDAMRHVQAIIGLCGLSKSLPQFDRWDLVDEHSEAGLNSDSWQPYNEACYNAMQVDLLSMVQAMSGIGVHSDRKYDASCTDPECCP